MGFFPTVNKGDKVQPTAEFHNAVVRTVNQVLNNRGLSEGRLARTRVTIPIQAVVGSGDILLAGEPIEIVSQGDFSWDARPLLVQRATVAQNAVGVVFGKSLNNNEIGSAVIFGLCEVRIPDNSTGNYVTLKAGQGGKLAFTRTSAQTSLFLIDQTTADGALQFGHVVWKMAEYASATVNSFHATLVGWNGDTKKYTIKSLPI